MRRPSPAIVGSLALHAGVVALALVSWSSPDEPKPLVNSVPVSIVSDIEIAAAPADNPQPEPSLEDGATAPVEVPPAPVPPEPKPTPPAPTPVPPTPRPTPPKPTPPAPAPRPTPTPAPRPTPPRPAPTPPAPARPTPTPPAPARSIPPAPARPAPAKPAPGLDLDALAGPPRVTPNRGRPAAGQQGAGTAPRAVGRGDMQALGAQVRPKLNNCDLIDGNELIRVRVRLNASGRLVRPPQLLTPPSPAASRVLSAISAAVPFDMPAGYEEQDLPFAFNTADFC